MKVKFQQVFENGTYTNENGINMQSYPKEWNSESITEFTKNVILGISNLRQDFCENCGVLFEEEEPAYYIEEEDITLCEECYIQYLAKKKSLL